MRDARSDRAHRERDDVERAPLHAAFVEGEHLVAQFVGIAPVVGRTGLGLVGGRDEGAIFDAGHVGRIGQREIRVGALVVGESLEGAGIDQLLADAVVLFA